MIADVEGRLTSTAATQIWAYRDGQYAERADDVCVEEPLEIRLQAHGTTQRLAITMRTPGADLELAAGFVLGERIVGAASEIVSVRHCNDRKLGAAERGNVVTVNVRGSIEAAVVLERHFTISSACGVCGTAGIELLRTRGHDAIGSDARIDAATLAALPERMRQGQRVFDRTGGLHAAALFDCSGTLLAVREDVGRHNAVDKIAGWIAFNATNTRHCALAVSGRCSYEIVQKALAAGIPIVASVSAPSSLAVKLARSFNLTLAGFVREGRWNVYAAPQRIAGGV